MFFFLRFEKHFILLVGQEINFLSCLKLVAHQNPTKSSLFFLLRIFNPYSKIQLYCIYKHVQSHAFFPYHIHVLTPFIHFNRIIIVLGLCMHIFIYVKSQNTHLKKKKVCFSATKLNIILR